MNIYLIERESCSYDEYDAFIIAATDEENARDIASHNCAGEGKSIWLDESTSCVIVGTTDLYLRPKKILGSFRAG